MAFCTELPVTPAVTDRRVRSITRTLTGAGRALPKPTIGTPPPRPARPISPETSETPGSPGTAGVSGGASWASRAQAMAALRHDWWPEGIAARRDALILTLHHAGLTRRQIRTLRPSQIDLPAPTTADTPVVVDAIPLPRHRDPVQCPRCALVRWLDVLAAYRHRTRYDLEDLLTNARTATDPISGAGTHDPAAPSQRGARHDCGRVLDRAPDEDWFRGWQRVSWVIPSIDRWGAIHPDTPLTGRAVTAILTRRHDLALIARTTAATQIAEPLARQPDLVASLPSRSGPVGRRPTPLEQRQLSDTWTQLETELDDLSARIGRLLYDLDRPKQSEFS